MRETLAALALAAPLVAIGGGVERWVVVASLGALALRRAKPAAVLLAATLLALAGHLLLDHHAYRLVWLYGAAEAPWPLRVAGLWAGDEATLLALAAACAALAPWLAHRGAAAGAMAAAAVFAAGALWWDPFQQIAETVRPAPNPHLQTVWMAVHPPLVLGAYALLLAPCGAALAALTGRPGAWPEIAARCGRAAWVLLSLGLVSGMAWAYEDFTFAPFWHWDPVQSAVFVVWTLATAHLHCLRSRAFPRLQPLLWLLTALAALLAMAVTRHPQLASSHRYAGDTSAPLMLVSAVGLALATLWAWWRSRPVAGERPPALLKLAVAGLGLCAAIVVGELAWASVAQALGTAKPAAAKPYYEMLARWAPADEMAALDAAFARWEPDPMSLDALLLPPAVVLSLLAGHRFVPLAGGGRWIATGAVATTALVLAWLGGPLQSGYRGTGMTASGTVAVLPWLDALLTALAYCGIAMIAFALRTSWRLRLWPAGLLRAGLVALAHAGMATGLAALLVATIFDSYGQKVLRWPEDAGRPVALPDGYTVSVGADGSSVAWTLGRNGHSVAAGAGKALQTGTATVRGPVRQTCEILDYRYARFAAGKSQMLTPAIDRGLWQDVQVWVGPMQDGQVAVVLKVYPMVTWVWLGFAAAVLAGFGLALLPTPKKEGPA